MKTSVFGDALRQLRSTAITRAGVEFIYKGDPVIYLWPWHRGPDARPWVSIGLSGTGEFGDARFHSLAEMDRVWQKLGMDIVQTPADKSDF